MNLTDFTIEELSQLEKLLEISNNVGNQFDKLCTLEINNQKNSIQYKQALLELTRAINIENETYQNIHLDYQQYYKFTRLLSSQINTGMFDIKPTNSIAIYQNRNIKRVINILVSIMQQNKKFLESIIQDDLITTISNITNNITKRDLIKGLEHNIQVQSSLDTDINSIFLSILEELITQREYQEYKQELIKIKYCIATTNKELEIFIIENKFNIPNIIYTNSKIINELLKEGELSYDIIRITELKAKAQTVINKLLRIKDSEYNNPFTYINSIINCCYLRALLSLMTNTEINDFNEEFHNKIEYLKEYSKDRISENMIISCFKSFNHDKRKIRILSTKSKN